MHYRFILYFFALLICFSCTEKKTVVGFMLPHTNIQRYKTEKETFTQKINELGGEVIFRQANNDDQYQIKQLDTLLEKGIDILVLDPVNRFTAAEMVRIAHRSGVKVISYDRLISNIDVDAFVTFDPWLVGKQIADAALKVKPEGTYIILGGDKSDLNAVGTDEGIAKTLEPNIKAGKITVGYRSFLEKWSADDAFQETKKYLNLTGKKPDVILAASDMIAQGALDAINNSGFMGEVILTGQGGELSGCKNIIAGKQLMTVYKPVKKLAVLSAELAFKMLHNQDVKNILNTTVHNGHSDIASHMLVAIPVNIENMKSTIVADGMVKESDLQLP